jgi:hypothetical protein
MAHHRRLPLIVSNQTLTPDELAVTRVGFDRLISRYTSLFSPIQRRQVIYDVILPWADELAAQHRGSPAPNRTRRA